MSTLDTSIKRPYFSNRKRSRVIDTNFKELTKTSSTNNTEELVKEYKRLKDSLPPEIHRIIYSVSSQRKGINPEEENFEEIDKLNHTLDELEAQENQEFIIDAREHPHFSNGTFIKGNKFNITNVNPNVSDNLPPEIEKELTYYYMQRGHKRQIENYDLFLFLYKTVNKRDPIKDLNKIPFLSTGELGQIPVAAPITLFGLGSETKFTDIFELPTGYIDASNLSEVVKSYQNNNVQPPDESTIKQKTLYEIRQEFDREPLIEE